jgi:hypothetical protein
MLLGIKPAKFSKPKRDTSTGALTAPVVLDEQLQYDSLACELEKLRLIFKRQNEMRMTHILISEEWFHSGVVCWTLKQRSLITLQREPGDVILSTGVFILLNIRRHD